VKHIFNKLIKYYTKNLVRILGIFVTGLLIITSIIYVKYKPSYKVTLNGQVIGYVESKENMQKMVDKYEKNLPENVAYITLNSKPQYELEFVSGDVKDDSQEVFLEIANSARVTYKAYVISYKKQKLQVNTEAEASEVVKALKNVDKKKIKVKEIYSERMLSDEEIEKALSKLENSIKKEAKQKAKAKVAKVKAQRKVTKVVRKKVTKRSSVRRKKVTTRHKNVKVKKSVANDVNTVSTGSFTFPVRGCSLRNVSNKHYPSYRGHTGIDVNISVKGKTVVAADGGVVILSKALKSGGSYRSYGEYVIIRHDNGKVTLYAHMAPNSRLVSKGDRVSRGQAIGKVGQTGNASGPHLHFEVRINGRPVNPFKYL